MQLSLRRNLLQNSNKYDKKELLENKAFMNAPDNAIIELPNWHYGLEGDEREDVFLSEVKYWDFKNQINLR